MNSLHLRWRALTRAGARIRFLLLLVPILAGCTDSLGFGSDCTAEMSQVRRREGNPDSHHESEFAGNHTVQWLYDDAGGSRAYTFRWGSSYDHCQVGGEAAFSIIPLTG